MNWFDFNFLVTFVKHASIVCLIFSLIIFVHEFGHYFVARLFGIRVEVFSIGLGPELFSVRDRMLTKWRIAALPLGGYIKIFGDDEIYNYAKFKKSDSKSLEISKISDQLSFSQTNLAQKMAVTLAGPAANLLFAILLLFVLLVFYGKPEISSTISTLKEGGQAERAGIKLGDTIIAVNGKTVSKASDISDIITNNPNQEMIIDYLRSNHEYRIKVTPEYITTKEGGRKASLGLLFDKIQYNKTSLLSALYLSTTSVAKISLVICSLLKQMFVNAEITKNLSGPIRIAHEATKQAELGLYSLLWFIAILSINLGLMNLLPILPLDGGRMLYYLLNLVSKPLSAKYIKYGLFISTLLIIILISCVAVNDTLFLLRS